MYHQKLRAEFIGTFALIFIGAGAVAQGGSLIAVAFAHGLVVAIFAYSYGPISGSHINPAVTFGLAIAKEIGWKDALGYWVAQILGGISGAGALVYVLGGSDSGLGQTLLAQGVSPIQGIVVEALLTFFLVNTIIYTTVKGKAGNLAPLAIGLTLTFAILMGGPLTGASLNPARTFGPALFGGSLDQFWIYLVGPFLGAAAAAILPKYLE